MPTKRHTWRHVEVGIHPHAASFQLLGHSSRSLDIRTPHRRSETRLRVIRFGNDIGFVLPLQRRQDRSKGLLGHNTGIFGGIVDDGGWKEIAFAVLGQFAADSWLPAFFGYVVEVRLDLLVLHAVLDRANKDAIIQSISDLELLRFLDQSGEELVIDLLVDVQPFDHHADLRSAEKGEKCDLEQDSIGIPNEQDDVDEGNIPSE